MSRDLIVKNLVTSDNLMKTVKSGADEGKKGNCVHGAQTREIRSQASSVSPHQLREIKKSRMHLVFTLIKLIDYIVPEKSSNCKSVNSAL